MKYSTNSSLLTRLLTKANLLRGNYFRNGLIALQFITPLLMLTLNACVSSYKLANTSELNFQTCSDITVDNYIICFERKQSDKSSALEYKVVFMNSTDSTLVPQNQIRVEVQKYESRNAGSRGKRGTWKTLEVHPLNEMNTAVGNFSFKSNLSSKGKYQLKFIISKVNGKERDKEIQVYLPETIF